MCRFHLNTTPFYKRDLSSHRIWCLVGCLWTPVTTILPGGLNGKESACNAGDPALIPGLGRSPGEGNSNPLHYSCLENPVEEAPGGLQSMGSQRVRHDWVTNTFTFSPVTTEGTLYCFRGYKYIYILVNRQICKFRPPMLLLSRFSRVWLCATP